jgi:hypothetical protein
VTAAADHPTIIGSVSLLVHSARQGAAVARNRGDSEVEREGHDGAVRAWSDPPGGCSGRV